MYIRHGVEVPDDQLRTLCLRYGVRELSLFGSSARGVARVDSDVDLLVVFEPDARVTLLTLAALQRELSEAIGLPVDLVLKEGLKPRLRDQVIGEARVLYAA